MLFYIYSDTTGTTIDITDRCRVGRLSVKDQAEEGAVAISQLIVDDPDGDLILTGHRRLYIYESDAPAFDQVIYNGFTSNERAVRGPYRTGSGRQWVIDLADVNVLINRRIMNGADANRPAETDLARIQALLTMTELNTVDDDSFVNTTAATTAMDAADYRGQNVGQYIDDCRQASGKNAYIYYNETLGEYGLWYDFDKSTVYDSGCYLTNVESLIDNDTVFSYSLERTYANYDPSRVASGIYLEYDGPDSPVYVQDAGTTAEFAAIDWAAPSVNVKTLTKATARANRYLVDAASEHAIIHTVAMMPRAKVTAIKKGQLVYFQGVHLPGFEGYTLCRVLNTTINEISEDPTLSFEIEMDLDPVPLVPCVDFELPLTPGGYYGDMHSFTTPADGVVYYSNATIPITPTPGWVGNWGFYVFNVGDAGAIGGSYDTAWAGAGNSAFGMFVGVGTVTAHLRYGYEQDGSNPDSAFVDVTLLQFDGIHWVPESEQLDVLVPLAGVDIEVVLPDDLHCMHIVQVEFGRNGEPGTGWRNVGFDGFTWVPV